MVDLSEPHFQYIVDIYKDDKIQVERWFSDVLDSCKLYDQIITNNYGDYSKIVVTRGRWETGKLTEGKFQIIRETDLRCKNK